MGDLVHVVAVLEARPTLWRWQVRTEPGVLLATFASAEAALRWIREAAGGPCRARHGQRSIEVTVPTVEALRHDLHHTADHFGRRQPSG